MNSLFIKLLIFLSLFFSSYLYADEANIGISVSNASANEDAGTMTFTITLDEAPLSSIIVNYKSIDGTAIAGTDYEAVDNNISFDSGVSSHTFTVNIIDNNIYEENNKYFKISANSDSAGYYSATDGTGTIIEDDTEQQPLTISIIHQSIRETDDNNSHITFTARLNKPAPAGGVTVSYETFDDSAKAGEDYIAKSGDIVIEEGDRDGFIDVDIIGDTIIEIPDTELFYIKLTNVTVVDSIEEDENIGIIYDNDFYPEINFEQIEYSIVEGNSSQKMLDVTFLFEEDVQDGASFHYETWDNTAEDQAGDNDYIYTKGDVNLTNGDRSYTIHIPINGDTKEENDEYFFIGISKLNKLKMGDNERVEVSIIDDDTDYSILTADDSYVSIVEGNNNIQSDLNFTFHLDKPALAGSSFDYYTINSSTNEDDYENIDRKTFTFEGGETNVTISVKVNGDNIFENNEMFYFQFDNEHNLYISGNQMIIGSILNDDIKPEEFECTTDGYLFSSQINDPFTNLSTLDLNNKTVNPNIDQFSDRPINAAGYNVKDNFIYGIGFRNFEINTTKVQLIQIDKNFNTVAYDVEGLPQGSRIYAHGDVNFDNKLYVSSIVDENGTATSLVELIVIDLSTKKVIDTIPLDFSEANLSNTYIKSADYAFNPIDKMLYTVDKYSKKILKINPTSGLVTSLGTLITDDTLYSVMTLFDRDGTFYFSNEGNTKLYSIDLSNTNNIDLTPILFQDGFDLDNSGDGVKCAYSTLEKELIPLICDDSMYISSSLKRGTDITGKMWLHRVDTSKNPFDFIPIDDAGEEKLYNALAFADSGDVNTKNYIFGIYNNKENKTHELIKLSKRGNDINLGDINGFPNTLEEKQFFAGAIYGNYYYVSGVGVDYNKIFKIDLRDKSVSEILLDTPISILDFSFTPDGNYLHGIIDGGELVKIDLTVTPSSVTKIGSPHIGYQFDSTFSDKNGRFFANDSKGNGFFEFDLNTGNKLFMSQSQKASFNDGTNCLKSALLFTDYSDAPISYGSPKHNIANGIFMGTKVDHDIQPFDTIDATGDDIDGVDDEDGVTFVDGTDINGSYFKTNTTQELNITVSKDGFLNVWLDYGIDNSFETVGDKVIESLALTAGTHTISFIIPENVTQNQTTYIRFRYSSTSNLNSTENATDGEVEDYAIKFGTKFQGIKGRFNIQRTNSALNAKDFALYTQIVGRDFNYHIVFYDENLTKEEQLIKVPLKIELINANDLSQTPIYTEYYYFSHNAPSTRVAVMDNSDLNTLPATKEALFKITYAINANGTIVQQECGADYRACFETLIASSEANRTDKAEDKFAIRPESFYITIADGNQERLNSRHPTEKTIRLASGYEYNLTLIATKWESLEPSLGYNKDFNSSFDFNMTGLTSCANTSPIIQPISYRDGIENIPNFKHDNVGHYKLTQATDENWTTIDQANNDCIANSAITSANGDSKSGCNIKLQIHPIDLEFYPDHFNVDLIMSNLPSSGHPNFIYMSEINTTYSDVSIGFQGDVTAQSENNITTTNFTTGCVSTNLLLDLNSTTISVEGINQNIETTEGTDVNFTRLIRFNSTSTTPTLELNQALDKINRVVAINSDKFLNENNGTVTLDMRYNINKNLTEPINPVEVKFHKMVVTSIEANSVSHDKTSITSSNIHTPTGEKAFTNNRKNFYFARVVSDLDNYPRVNLNISPVVRTPLNVDIFCKTTINNYCEDREVLNNTNLAGTIREQTGWYLSTNHHFNLDGNVTNLNAIPNIVNIIPTTINPITLTNGKNGLIMEKFIDCSSPKSTIKITTSPALRFEPSQYIVNCTNQNPSQWTGVGKTGNILKIKPNINGSGKMDW